MPAESVSILDYIGAEDDGGDGDNRSHKTCKAPIVTTNKPSPSILQARCPSSCPTNSVRENTEHQKYRKTSHSMELKLVKQKVHSPKSGRSTGFDGRQLEYVAQKYHLS